jgi:hypothetical protein
LVLEKKLVIVMLKISKREFGSTKGLVPVFASTRVSQKREEIEEVMKKKKE